MQNGQINHDAAVMLAEHERLRILFQEMRIALSERRLKPALMVDFVTDFVQHVLAHFEHEEADGYFVDIVVVAPRLNGQVEMLRRQHDLFREGLADLRDLADCALGIESWWRALESRFHDFADRFEKHEHAENDLFQEAYERDIGAED